MKRRIPVGVCCLPILLGGAAAVHAQSSESLENIVVTGSRIARADFESASPIVTVPGQAFLQTGAPTVERTLNQYPQFVPTVTGTSNEPSNDGQSNISLRGLGTAQTLVLLDGRRMVPADGRGSVDLNVLPPALIRSVEVVTGGASAAYGSDAIAGVVNFKLEDAFEGVTMDGTWAQTNRGDGEEYSLGVTAGTRFAEGRGSVMGYVGYVQRAQIDQDARRFSRYPLEYFPGNGGGEFIATGSGITENGFNVVFSDRDTFRDLFTSYGFPAAPYFEGIGVNGDGTVFTTGNGNPGSVVNYRGDRDPVMFNDRFYSVFNHAPYTALRMPLQRTSAFLSSRYDFTEDVSGYLQALYADYTVDRQLAPAAAGILLIPPTQPDISPDLQTLLDSRVNPSAPYRYFRRMSEVGPQEAENDRSLVQVTVGASGQLRDDWQFDGYAQFGQNDRTERQTNNVLLSKLQDLTFAADGGRSICSGGFNPFVAGSLSQECAAYVAADAANDVTVRQAIAELSASGPLASLPAGELRAAAGVFYKRDEFEYDADATLSAVLPGVPGVIGPRPDVAGFAAAPDREGHESNTDVYVELRVPILENRPAARSLELGLGYRYSDYTQAGGVNSYRGELLYRPTQPLLLRGTYSHAVRAPSIEELYYPPVSSQFEIPRPDPCSASSDQRQGADRLQVEALCLAQGLPADRLPTYEFNLRRVDGVSGGNPDLEAEQADTYTVGIVMTGDAPGAAFPGLKASLDWYHIEIEDGIGRWDSKSAVERCYDPRYNPQYDVANIYCSFFERRPDTGEIRAVILDRNIGGIVTAGVDLQIGWSLQAGPGRLGLSGFLTYVDTWQYIDPSGGTIEYAGTIGGALGRSLPRWKSLLGLDYAVGDLALFAAWRYVDGQRDVAYPDFDVPSADYFDLGASYTIRSGALSGFTARVGFENLFDEDPPIYPSAQQANTDPSQYDVLGRRWYLTLQYRL